MGGLPKGVKTAGKVALGLAVPAYGAYELGKAGVNALKGDGPAAVPPPPAAPDFTDEVIRVAERRELGRRQMGRTRASTFTNGQGV